MILEIITLSYVKLTCIKQSPPLSSCSHLSRDPNELEVHLIQIGLYTDQM